ncbi:MAG: FlgD immunoglobulin-like domain containing protein [Calditrichia bacterium]
MKKIKNDSPSFANYNVSRRDFIRFLTLSGISATFFPYLAFGDSCDLTTDDIQGPFYSPGAPMRTVLASSNEPGSRLFISGTIYGDDCTTPLEGTIVDVWAANDSGCYGRFESCTPAGDAFNLRGQMLTNSAGQYAFETIRPGAYLNGNQFRPQHIHLRFVSPGGVILVTQLYFEGDPYIADDPWASSPDAVNRIIPLTQQTDGYHGVFDANLDEEIVTGIDDPDELSPDQSFLHQNYPNPFNGQTTIRYSLPTAARVRLAVYDQAGREITRLEDIVKPAGFYTSAWNGENYNGRSMSSGIYYYRLSTEAKEGRFTQTRKLLMIK